MAEPVNKSIFHQPHWRVIAQGFQTETWFNEGQAIGTGGILNPKPIDLRTGQYYYRFASSNSSREAQFGGGWWLDYENYKKIEDFSKRNGYHIRDAARLMLALPYAWTRVDLMVKALLTLPVMAYAGEGKLAKGSMEGPDKGTAWIPTQHIKVCQLYIPGLFVKGSRPRDQLYEKVFMKPVSTSLL